MAWLWICALLALLFFDVHYFVRNFISIAWSLYIWKFKRRHVFYENQYNSICWTRDMDYSWHMNNTRYIRETDSARFHLLIETGLFASLHKRGASALLGASTIRYRRSIQLFERYTIKSKIIGWDDRAFVIEHRWVRRRDQFICAIMLARQMVTGPSSPAEAVNDLLPQPISSPELPPEVKLWLEANQISSETLRKES